MAAEAQRYESLKWRNIGPHRGGRVTCVAGDPDNDAVFYMGSCGGGVFKTDDGGDHWFNVTDGYFNTAAIGAIAVAPSNSQILYVGTGESTIRSNVSHGDGVYKTVDGGKSWEHLGLAETRYIGQIVVHPDDPNTVLVAALGHAWGENEERGVYKTTDGGATWTKTLYKSPRAGAVDLSQDPSNPNVVYAAVWQAQRYPWAASSGGEDSGLWKSTDCGETWEDITDRLRAPACGCEGVLGKIGVAISPANPDRIWALVEAENGAMCRSDDGGETWKRVSDNPELRRRAWYYMHVFADPSDADTVWVLNLQCWKSSDGGANYEAIPTPHGDNHGLWIDPNDSDRLIEGNDGGACVSYNGGKTWSTILNQPTAQFYHVTTDTQDPYHVYGSQQDNWAMRLPSVSFEGAISWKDYVEPGGGESGYIAIKPTEPHTVFGGGIGTGLGHGRLRAWNPHTRQSRNVTVWPEVHGFGAGTEKHKYRFQWTFPLEISPHDPNKLYACSNVVHVSTDEGASWTDISPDLTRNDPEKQQSSGGPITSDNSGAEIYCTIFAFQESPHQAGVLWAGSDDGLIHLSKDGGQNWENITPPADMLPEWARISIIELSPHTDGKAYVAANRYQLDDNRPYLLKTEDYGQSWTEINNGIRSDDITRTIREDPVKAGLLYCGTETGLYVSHDDGASWESLQPSATQGLPGSMPVTPIYDLVVKGDDLVVATNGRSFWVLDDVTPLRQMAGADSDQITLYRPKDTIRWRINQGFMRTEDATRYGYKMVGPVTVTTQLKRDVYGNLVEQFVDAGENPPDGVLVHWWLPEETEDEIKISFLDADGNELRSYSSKAEDNGDKLPVRAGANRLTWDLRTQKPTEVSGETSTNRMVNMMMMNATPKVPPGEYQVKLTANGVEQTQSFNLLIDPRIPVATDDLQAQYEMKSQIRDRLSEVNETINGLRSVRDQVDQWVSRAADNDEIKNAAESLKTKLGDLENDLMLVDTGSPKMGASGVREKLGALAGMIDESDHAPTQQAREVYGNLAEDAVTCRQRLSTIVDSDIDDFSGLLQRHNVPLISATARAVDSKQETAAD